MPIEYKLIPNQSLKELSTIRIGGIAKLFVEIETIQEMVEIRHFINREKIPYWVVGRGSNSLFDDRGFDGLVLLNSIHFFELNEGHLHVGAGYNFSLLGSQTARGGWEGLEFASGIPGTIGGAIYMNAGANGSETCDTLLSVGFINRNGELVEKKKEDLCFSYRFSTFQTTEDMIVYGNFQLKKSEDVRVKQRDLIQKRIRSQPYQLPSAGCIFRNPKTGKSAGALIEACGLKGKRIGDAEVSTIHANFIVNQGNATAQEVLELATSIQNIVEAKTGVKLEMEVKPIPYTRF